MSETSMAPSNNEPANAPHPPQDLAAEQSVLGGMMLSADAITDVTEQLRTRDFYRPAHQAIYEAILMLYGLGEPADAITVAAELEHEGQLSRVGGGSYLHTLIATVPTAANAAYYAEIVSEKAVLRRLVEAGTRITQLGYHGAHGAELSDVVDNAQAAIHDATVDTQHSDHTVTGGHASAELLADLRNGDPQEVIPTGYADLDSVLDGYARGEVTVVCGRPGHGKTMLGVSAIRATAIYGGLSTFMFSLEMGRKLLLQRLLASTPAHGIELAKLRKKIPMEPRDWAEAERAHERISDTALWIDDNSHQTVSTIRTTLRRHIQQHGPLDVVVIDYLGLLTALGRPESRNIAVQEMSRELKVVADELQVAMVLLHQLSRKTTDRTDRKPQLADLRDSGAVEQDAYAVVAVQNHQVDDPNTDRNGEVDLHVLKNRQGATSTITAAFQPRFGRVVDLSSEEPAQERAAMTPKDRAAGGMPKVP